MSILDKRNYVADEFWYRLDDQICWWDSRIKFWTTYKIDDKGNQTSEAQYYANRDAVYAAEDAGTFGLFQHDYTD